MFLSLFKVTWPYRLMWQHWGFELLNCRGQVRVGLCRMEEYFLMQSVFTFIIISNPLHWWIIYWKCKNKSSQRSRGRLKLLVLSDQQSKNPKVYFHKTGKSIKSWHQKPANIWHYWSISDWTSVYDFSCCCKPIELKLQSRNEYCRYSGGEVYLKGSLLALGCSPHLFLGWVLSLACAQTNTVSLVFSP